MVVLRDPTAGGEDLAVLGFVMKQNELWDDWNGASLLDLSLYQVGLAEIGGYAGLHFGSMELLDEFVWRQPRFRDRSRMRPISIRGPENIQFFGPRRRAGGVRAFRLGASPRSTDPMISSPRSQNRPCDCNAEKETLHDQIDVLARQVRALQEVVDAFLQEIPKEEENPALREAEVIYKRIVGGEMTGPGEFHAGRKLLGKDSCNGDSGGPAYMTTADSFKLAGLTSRAAFSSERPCGDGGIYTRLTPYLNNLLIINEK